MDGVTPQRPEDELLGRLERIDLPGGEPGPGWAWWCPGCLSHHAVDGRWSVSGEKTPTPSIVPSVVVRDRGGRVLCHSMIRAGVIEFFSDCSHPWAGNNLPMEAFEPPGWDRDPGAPPAAGENATPQS